MSEKREAVEDVYAADPRRLSEMVKAVLLEPQFLRGGMAHPSVARLYADAPQPASSFLARWDAQRGGHER